MKFVLARLLISVCLLYPVLASASNSYPVVLVHGFGGWGRDELFGLKYWGGGFISGGDRDLQAVLASNGTVTKTAAVGPLSSNWDRAVELFYQIKGGCVDYGPFHSVNQFKTNGQRDTRTIIRKLDGGLNPDGTRRPRKCWAANAANNPNNDPLALYPEWGNDASKKIHLVAHSQGGQTVRQLLQLLRAGSPNDLAADSSLYDESRQANPFRGGKNWVSSITTLATPHDGTTLATGVQMLGFVQQLVGAAATAAGLSSGDSVLYDLKLEQFGLKRNPGAVSSLKCNTRPELEYQWIMA
jgi:triacylglycerol lipase